MMRRVRIVPSNHLIFVNQIPIDATRKSRWWQTLLYIQINSENSCNLQMYI